MTDAASIPVAFADETGSSWRAFLPNRPLASLLFGAFTFEERWRLLLAGAGGVSWDPARYELLAAPLSVPTPSLCRAVAGATGEIAWVDDENGVVAVLRRAAAGEAEGAPPLDEAARGLPEAPALGGRRVAQPWELIARNGAQIEADLEALPGAGMRGRPPGGAAEGNGSLRWGEGTRLEPHVFYDTREGPIAIGDRVVVEAHATIRGPVCIRHDAVIRGAAKIVEGTTVGEASRVGGEVECTIFGAFSNKQHDGFLGHAVAGEWVNLGAATNNSDLKNNYGTVRVDFGDGPLDTGSAKVGCFLGDHVKSAIGTRIGTGTVVGPCANLFGPSGLVTGHVPPFTWGEGGDLYDYDRAMETIRTVRERRVRQLERAGRPRELPESEREALRRLWEAARRRSEG